MKVFEKPSEDQGKQVNRPEGLQRSVFYLLLPDSSLPISLRNIPLAVSSLQNAQNSLQEPPVRRLLTQDTMAPCKGVTFILS